jgi:hypothetical protein
MKSSVNNGYKVKQKIHIPLTMSAGETIKVECHMGFYHSPTGGLLSHMGFYPHSIKMGDKNNGSLEKIKN